MKKLNKHLLLYRFDQAKDKADAEGHDHVVIEVLNLEDYHLLISYIAEPQEYERISYTSIRDFRLPILERGRGPIYLVFYTVTKKLQWWVKQVSQKDFPAVSILAAEYVLEETVKNQKRVRR